MAEDPTEEATEAVRGAVTECPRPISEALTALCTTIMADRISTTLIAR